MSLKVLKCPNCQANLEIKDKLEVVYCQYCGTKIQLDISKEELDVHMKLKEYEHEEIMQSYFIEHEKFKLQEKRKKEKSDFWFGLLDSDGFKIFSVCAIICLIVIGCMFSSSLKHNARIKELKELEADIIECIENKDYLTANKYVENLRLDDGYSKEDDTEWENKRLKYVKEIIYLEEEVTNTKIEIEVPESSDYFKNTNCYATQQIFIDAGFLDVQVRVSPNHKFFLFKDDLTDFITIGGQDSFEKNDKFSPTDVVLIYYLAD